MRARILLLPLVLTAAAAIAAESPVNISGVETKDLRLFYYYYLSFLQPYTVRTFTNSLEWQRHIFGWQPSERVIVELRDFGDYGNAIALSAPHSELIFDVS